ncbi:centromere-associated protein E isoform X2 [Sceloporus undulatus]|uniref:centromere-associated protein E isoform X2 n=1 Tax=Sceloporus undulatus TaxID=8520 RepID=UPI001C4B47C6|nr:centromere-associated protein E isoform X2 [Sceloporus undulatus]
MVRPRSSATNQRRPWWNSKAGPEQEEKKRRERSGRVMAGEGDVTVCVRVRPLLARENEDLDDKGQMAWKSEDCTVSQIDGTRSFTFDRVFHSEDSTTKVYQGVAAPIIKSAVQGYNGTIFAYGQTASGKTYTMLGTRDCPGILPMAIHDVFNTICKIPDREFLLRISYMEIHNETIQDLLCINIRKKKPLVVREDINRTIYVEDLSEEVVISPEQVLNWIQKGEKNRHYGETKMNERSSRSHTIFRMIIESKEKDTSSSSYEGAVMVSHLNLVDLAGSERASQTGSEGIRLKEGCNINRSLFILSQVIKKLCDDQSGGFINYRDSKLTRILQNSLGGNAKTVIICTITPVSLEETLSTLQFASTAKKMKNTPKVNEVLDDDALLKRYRKEIEDLKRRLDEVSSHSHTKDQLAQLLEEKDSLQKQQEDRIRALTEMLVTASSFSREQELKTKRKRRVTWAPGAISQDAGLCFLEDLPSRGKRFKASFSSLPEMEESMSSEFSDITASGALPEEEWVPGSEINFDNTVTEQSMRTKLDNLKLENNQLRYELTELKEKMSIEEFEVLENETAKEQEMQLMHEISSLKAIIANAEVYNQDLQEEIKSKDMQLKEQANKVKVLENNVAELKNLMEDVNAENGKRDRSFSIQIPNKGLDEMQQMKQSLSDAEAVALDAKRESAFFRSENMVLTEKMTQLLESYSKMEKDNECYRRQLEAGKVTYKKMQSDLQKELQYYLQENSKLTSLLEGKVPKDILSCIELERKIEGLKNELNKALEENTALRKELTVLSEAGSGPDLEIFQKEILEKAELISLLTSEKENLLSQVAEKERLLQEATNALKSKEDFTNTDIMRANDMAFQELKHHCDELGQKFMIASEDSKQMKGQVDLLSDENLKLNTVVNNLTLELSSKSKELQQKNLEQIEFLSLKEQFEEAHKKLSEMDQLRDQLKTWESKMEAGEKERLAITQKLHDSEEEIIALTQERNDLKQKQEALEQERDQIKEDIQETVSINIEVQEELRVCHNSLQQYQNHIQELEKTIAEGESQMSDVRQSLGITIEEQKQQILKLTKDLEHFNVERNLSKPVADKIRLEECDELQLMKEQIFALEQERAALQQQLGALQEETNKPLESSQLVASKNAELDIQKELYQSVEKQNEMEEPSEHLKSTESVIEEELTDNVGVAQNEEAIRALIQERDDLRDRHSALQTERDQLKEETHATQAMIKKLEEECLRQKQSLELREEQSQEDKGRLVEMEQLKASAESKMEAMEKEKAELSQKLHTTMEDMRSITMENANLKITVESLQSEKVSMIQTVHRLGETIERTVARNLELQEQLQHAHSAIEAHTKMVAELKGEIVDKESWSLELQKTLKQEVETEMENLQAQIRHQEEKINNMNSIIDEKTNLLQKLEAKCLEESEQLNEELSLHIREKERLAAELKDQADKVHQLTRENSLLQKERKNLQEDLQSLKAENGQLQEKLLENTAKFPETNVKQEQQDDIKSLEVKVLRIKEVLKSFSSLEKKSEYLKTMSLQIKHELDHQKSVVAKGLADLPSQQAKAVKRLQMEHGHISNSLHSLLNKFQFFFTCICKKKAEYYTKVSTYTTELLDERRKQLELLTQIRHLKKCNLEEHQATSHQLNISELNQYLDLYTEKILKDTSEMEEELLSIEGKLKQLKSDGEESKQYLERCSVHFDVQDFEGGIQQDNETLMSVGRFLNPKAQAYIQAKSELDTRNADYYRETEVALKVCREQTKELFLELNAFKEEVKLKEEQTLHRDANLALKEENCKLENKLKAAEEGIKNLKQKIQELENGVNEADRNLQEKEKRIAILQMELNVRTSGSEVPKLKAALEEKENGLRIALTEMESLKAQLNKGAELYKEEIEDLKTQLVKADMAKMKQSKYFDQEMANAKALAEYREEQLRKLKEELRKAQQDQDITVISNKDLPQPSLPITCGGGSGIVQNTQLLVLKTEHAKLEKKYSQLQKEHEIVLTNVLSLKEEAKKWKDRALKSRTHSSRGIDEEQIPKSPRKTAPPLFSELPASPSRERSLKPILPVNTPPAAPSDGLSFFAEPSLGNLTDTRATVAESTENNLKHWIATANKDDASKCKTQ